MELGGGANQHGQDNMARLEHHAHQGMLGWYLVCLALEMLQEEWAGHWWENETVLLLKIIISQVKGGWEVGGILIAVE